MRWFGKSLLNWRIAIAALGVLLVVGLGYAYWYSRRPPGPEGPHELPGGRLEDREKAEKYPDAYAWDLFLGLNRQALPGMRGVPDPSKPTIKEYDSNKPVVWETWARSSGGRRKGFLPEQNCSEVFLNGGRTPVPWEQLGDPDKCYEAGRLKEIAGLLEETAAEQTIRSAERTDLSDDELRLLIEPTIAGDVAGIGEEVRMNRATYEFVIANNLYNLEGLEATFSKPAGTQDPRCPAQNINAPPAAQEIKALWSRISESDMPRYHWRELNKNGKKEIWGLIALHITTKDLCNWFWCDFEHIDYLAVPGHSVDSKLGVDSERAVFPSRDTTVPQDVNILHRVRPETVGTKWANYRLRGTQIDFVEKNSANCEQPTILANTQIEKRFQETSSCITCHARATIGKRDNETDFEPKFLTVFEQREPVLIGYVGKPDPGWFMEGGQQKYIQTDFMWSFAFRAQSTIATPTPPSSPTPTPSPCP